MSCTDCLGLSGRKQIILYFRQKIKAEFYSAFLYVIFIMINARAVIATG